MPKTARPGKSSDRSPARLRDVSLPPQARRLPPRTLRVLRIAGIVLASLVVLAIGADLLLDEPIRRTIETNMNRSLKGYTVRVPGLDFRLFGLSVTLRDVVVRQEAHPEPAVLVVPALKASVHWKELLSLRLVADFKFDRPRLYVNLAQLRSEDRDAVPIDEKGWQDALHAIYPLKINLLRVEEGDVTYVDEDPRRPLRLRRLKLRATNIRNIHSPDHVYPSPVHAEAVVFDSGRAVVEGHANFLAKPFPGVHLLFDIRDVPLNDLGPIVQRADLSLRGGALSTNGRIEYSPVARNAHVRDLTIRRVRLDYLSQGEGDPAGQRLAKATKKAAGSEMKVRLDRLRVLESNIGMRNQARDYRVFLSPASLEIENFSNYGAGKPARARLEGRFMGSGKALATASFRATPKGPDLDARVEIGETDMTRMNDLLRAHGNFDVTAGKFSFYSEVQVRDGAISGYVKPLFQDLEVYDQRQDARKGFFKKLYESVVEIVAEILENQPRDEVGSVVQIRGRVQNPESSTLQVIFGLIENAFFDAILPGFERDAAKAGKGKPGSKPA
ncbi:MAG TPA: DUF748 domain-containing protein [Thermoanaerobaculia bacterium]|jgi:hypothetical protein